MTGQVDFLVKVRDAAALVLDATNEYLESLAPPGAGSSASYDLSKIAWSKASGAKGEYERSEDVNSLDFKALLKDLQAHKGCMRKDGYFYWVFENGTTIGRKKQ